MSNLPSRIATVLLMGCAASQLAAAAEGQPAPATDKTDFIGSNTCRTCHPDVASTFFRNPHFKSVASATETPDHTGCEGCHGPGRTHAESMGKSPIARRFSKMTQNQVLDTCLTCHAK